MVRPSVFKTNNDFSLYIEQLRVTKNFETITETLVYFYENESDHEMEDISKMLNQKLVDILRYEAEQKGLIKNTTVRLM